MSKINIYETGWLNMVFEGRNKAYGAYQLRSENPKTTVKAFFSAILLLAGVAAIPVLINYLEPKKVTADVTPLTLDDDIILVDADTFIEEEPKKKDIGPADSKPLTDEKVIKYVNMVPTEKEKVTEEATRNEELETGKIGTTNQDGNESNSNTAAVTTTTDPNGGSGNENPSTVEVLGTLEVMPQYPGGVAAFLNTVGKKFKTPEVDENVKLLRVIVYFVIEKDGTLSNIKVTKDPGYNLGKEAERVLKSINTKWTPGYKNGKPVRTAYTLPITVNIQ
ncbi:MULTISPECIES: energy transducer TonB [Flavobacterium]|uniref:energy transducer TonB n=1 Tax=Flavobacterium TaxID=237 RepID=UPI001FCC4C04|nr:MULTISPECIES: energy transducer TonB [Flavobacterium]UOK43855.1 energy transducer TonB [Flavobacterium enshiense]